MKYFVKTYGCTFNEADTDRIIGLAEGVHERVQKEEDAEVIVLNTCSVKDATQQKILHEVSSTKKQLVVTGCLAQASPELIQKYNPNASVVGTFAHKRINEAISGEKIIDVSRSNVLPLFAQVDGLFSRIQINSGCASFCTFCSTKLARGNTKSYDAKELVYSIQKSVELGAKEIQLCSQDTGCYGQDLGYSLVDLLERIKEIPGDFRVRLGMLNPEHVLTLGEPLLGAFDQEKMFKFVHLPLQSGSDSVLKHMRRHYNVSEFKQAFFAFKNRFPEAMMATDVIVGYPTETDEDFRQTMNLIKELRFDVVNVSKFSPRPNTIAAKLPQLNNAVVKKRSAECSELCRKISLENNSKLVGKEFDVLLLEKGTKEGQLVGKSGFYKSFVLNSNAELGSWVKVKAVSAGVSFIGSTVSTLNFVG
ncbi:tRNA (N(6)-L-threonylcarbamoyladenosine(37)-C(2))-methylthiotransferase [Candidatus Micrarchaeota archaeon]|nr:tRNA (N(6)-L-threonylcarbamoyladenosine(37)-C(2))-methylthiotransferase [Candidatus Micrarchaeota archaeon]